MSNLEEEEEKEQQPEEETEKGQKEKGQNEMMEKKWMKKEKQKKKEKDPLPVVDSVADCRTFLVCGWEPQTLWHPAQVHNNNEAGGKWTCQKLGLKYLPSCKMESSYFYVKKKERN